MFSLKTIHLWDIFMHFLYISLFPDPAILTYLIKKINFKLLNAPKSLKLVLLFRMINSLTKNSKHLYKECCGGGGRTRLPKFKFSAKFPVGLHVILQIQIIKIQKYLISYVKKIFWPQIRWGLTLNPRLEPL